MHVHVLKLSITKVLYKSMKIAPLLAEQCILKLSVLVLCLRAFFLKQMKLNISRFDQLYSQIILY